MELRENGWVFGIELEARHSVCVCVFVLVQSHTVVAEVMATGSIIV